MPVAITEAGTIALATAFISAGTAIVVAFLSIGQRRRGQEAKIDRDELKAAVKTSNGKHDTLGNQLDHIEHRINKLEDVQTETLYQVNDLRANSRMTSEALVKHLDEWDPLLEWARNAQKKDRKKEGK